MWKQEWLGKSLPYENGDGSKRLQAEALKSEFFMLNGNAKTIEQANGMIKTFITMGCSEKYINRRVAPGPLGGLRNFEALQDP